MTAPSTDLAYISTTLKGAVEMMSDDERRFARDCFEHYRSEWTRIASEEPQCVAHTVQVMVDELMQGMLATSVHAKDVQCRKGCAACCRMYVDVFPQEAVLLRMVARENGIGIDEARLARQAAKDQRSWVELVPDDRRCVFLDEGGACRVYEHRPAACRKYLVKTAPALCDSVKHPGNKVGIVFSAEAEIAHSAAMTAYGSGGMATMLHSLMKP